MGIILPFIQRIVTRETGDKDTKLGIYPECGRETIAIKFFRTNGNFQNIVSQYVRPDKDNAQNDDDRYATPVCFVHYPDKLYIWYLIRIYNRC